jgi:hypothetical protein
MGNKIRLCALCLFNMLLLSCGSIGSRTYTGEGTSRFFKPRLIVYENNTFELLSSGGYVNGTVKELAPGYKLLKPAINMANYRQIKLESVRIKDTIGPYLKIINFYDKMSVRVSKNDGYEIIYDKINIDTSEIYIPLDKSLIMDTIRIEFNYFQSEEIIVDSFGLEIYPLLPKCLFYQFYQENEFFVLNEISKNKNLITSNLVNFKACNVVKRSRLTRKEYNRLLNMLRPSRSRVINERTHCVQEN